MSTPSALGGILNSIGIISDIHGNITALTEVFKSLAANNVTRIFCLGDLVGKGPQSSKVIDLCREKCEVVVKGNWDDMILQNDAVDEVKWHFNQLNSVQVKYLNELPHSYDLELGNKNIRLFHSSAIGIYYRVHMYDSYENHRNMFMNTEFTNKDINPDVIGYGDIHGDC